MSSSTVGRALDALSPNASSASSDENTSRPKFSPMPPMTETHAPSTPRAGTASSTTWWSPIVFHGAARWNAQAAATKRRRTSSPTSSAAKGASMVVGRPRPSSATSASSSGTLPTATSTDGRARRSAMASASDSTRMCAGTRPRACVRAIGTRSTSDTVVPTSVARTLPDVPSRRMAIMGRSNPSAVSTSTSSRRTPPIHSPRP
jgi:hypothetical protein